MSDDISTKLDEILAAAKELREDRDTLAARVAALEAAQPERCKGVTAFGDEPGRRCKLHRYHAGACDYPPYATPATPKDEPETHAWMANPRRQSEPAATPPDEGRIPEGFEKCTFEQATKDYTDEGLGILDDDLGFWFGLGDDRSDITWLRPRRIDADRVAHEAWENYVVNGIYGERAFRDSLRRALTSLTGEG